MSEGRRQAPAAGDAGLALAMRDGEVIALEDTGALRRLLRVVVSKTVVEAGLPADVGARLAPLLPVLAAPPEPDWLRAEEMLEEAAACPGERLFAGTLASGAQWWRPGDMRATLQVLQLALATGATLPEGLDAGRVARGCLVLETALERLSATALVQVRDAVVP